MCAGCSPDQYVKKCIYCIVFQIHLAGFMRFLPGSSWRIIIKGESIMAIERPLQGGRRKFVRLAVAGPAGAVLAGCIPWFSKKPVPICPNSPQVSYPRGPLTIDAHCHVFNGTDLPIHNFFTLVLARQKGPIGEAVSLLASVLEGLAWSLAPSFKQETARLRELDRTLQACRPDPRGPGRVVAMRQEAYQVGRRQLVGAMERSPVFQPYLVRFRNKQVPEALDDAEMAKYDVVGIIDTLPEDVDAYTDEKSIGLYRSRSRNGVTLRGMIRFVLQNFQYRYVSVHDYLRTYNEPGTRTVDLMLPSIVDYDFWISRGKRTHTSLAEQVALMEHVSILTGGRVHAFVPFDPLRQVAFELGKTNVDSIGLVIDALEKRGAMGVKLYPPMGFAPLGNVLVQKEKGEHFWARSWLPAWTDSARMGRLLDGAMTRLFEWCANKGIPIMAHTARSNGPHPEFEELSSARYWDIALKEFPSLRINFGHFGDTSLVGHGDQRARSFMALMKDGAHPGGFAYADAGFFAEVMESEPQMLAGLRLLYEATADKGGAALSNRLLYGTDWEMTLSNWPVGRYMSQFVKLMDEIEQRPALRAQGAKRLSEKFFGENAARFLGLRKGEQTRDRLTRFYREHEMPDPDWMAKVDAIPS